MRDVSNTKERTSCSVRNYLTCQWAARLTFVPRRWACLYAAMICFLALATSALGLGGLSAWRSDQDPALSLLQGCILEEGSEDQEHGGGWSRHASPARRSRRTASGWSTHIQELEVGLCGHEIRGTGACPDHALRRCGL